MERKLLSILLSFTNRCNLCCSHCGYDFAGQTSKPSELPCDFFLSVAKQAIGLGLKRITVTGGEIFMRPDATSLIEGLVKLGLDVQVESNGTLVGPEQIQRLSDLGSKVRVAISVDGADEKTHDGIRGSGSFRKTMAAVESLSNMKVACRVNTVLQESNYEQIPRMARLFVDEMGVGFRLLPSILEYGRGVYANEQAGVSFEKIEQLLDSFFYDFIRERAGKDLSIGLNVALIPPDIESCIMCGWAESIVGIGPTGKVSMCHVSNDNDAFVVGDLKTQTITEIWTTSERLQELRDISPRALEGVCSKCLAIDVCRGGCRLHAFSKYGSLLAPDPQCQTVYELGKFPEFALMA